MTTDEWNNISEKNAHLPGPRTIFVSGYGSSQTDILRQFLSEIGYPDISCQICRKSHLEMTLEAALASDPSDEPLPEGALPYVAVLSGVKLGDVRAVMQRFKENGLPRPIFATTTQTNLTFTVKTLLQHLMAEQKMANQ